MKSFLKVINIIAVVISVVVSSNSAMASDSINCEYSVISKVGLAGQSDKMTNRSVFLAYSSKGKVQMKHVLKDMENETFVKWSDGPDDYALILSGESLAFFTHKKNNKLISYMTGSMERAKTVCREKGPKFIRWTSNGQTDFFNNESLKNQFGFYIERTMKN